jgi:hypothetical protein
MTAKDTPGAPAPSVGVVASPVTSYVVGYFQ